MIHSVPTAFIDECSGYGMDHASINAVGTEWITPGSLMNAVGMEWIMPGGTDYDLDQVKPFLERDLKS